MKQHAVDQFWRKYLFILEKSSIPVKIRRWYRIHVKHAWLPILVSNLKPTSLLISTNI